MKTADEVKPNYGPVYTAAMYPALAQVFVQHGYALAVHGSLARDLDLIAVPWVDTPSPLEEVMKAVKERFPRVEFLGPPTQKPHGRVAHTLSIGWGHCAVDLSVMPQTAQVFAEETPSPTQQQA